MSIQYAAAVEYNYQEAFDEVLTKYQWSKNIVKISIREMSKYSKTTLFTGNINKCEKLCKPRNRYII